MNATIDLIESTSNMLRGMCMDPRIPADTKQALQSRIGRLDSAAELAADVAAAEEGALSMVRWAYGKLHRQTYSKQEDALMLDRMKLLLEHGVA